MLQKLKHSPPFHKSTQAIYNFLCLWMQEEHFSITSLCVPKLRYGAHDGKYKLLHRTPPSMTLLIPLNFSSIHILFTDEHYSNFKMLSGRRAEIYMKFMLSTLKLLYKTWFEALASSGFKPVSGFKQTNSSLK